MMVIDATKAIESIDEIVCSMSVCINSDYCNGMRAMKDMALHAIEKQPTVDAVPVRVIEQFKWERDTAIQQLEEHGIPFCGKADVVAVVRCKECKHRPKYDGPNRVVFPDGICPCQCDDEYYNWMPSDDWFCPDGERKNDANY